MYVKNSYVSVSQTTTSESLHNAVNAGLHVKQDWVDMGFGIADTVAKIVDQVLKFV
ncbi:MAG: beta-class phenol-soluble modulin [Staphylococcus epidermidis]|nr:beta-class phenol-soluble modulin [Staphylococcus epidermidis]